VDEDTRGSGRYFPDPDPLPVPVPVPGDLDVNHGIRPVNDTGNNFR
jgi:hypothetical protein